MIAARHSIFRDKALKHYTQSRKKDVLPSFSSIPAALFAWILLVMLLATGLLAWYVQVPVYVPGAGMIFSVGSQTQAGSNGVIALAFFAPNAGAKLRVSQSVQIQAGSGPQITSEIAEVEPGLTSPASVLERYGIQASNASLSSQLVVVARLKWSKQSLPASYQGSSLVIQASVATQSLFSALTGIGKS